MQRLQGKDRIEMKRLKEVQCNDAWTLGTEIEHVEIISTHVHLFD